MRRLPIYFLVDVSESMVGTPIEQVQDGMASIVNELRTDPYALETAYLSVIAFAGKAKMLSPLQELYKFYPPKFPIGGGTSLGTAMNYLMDEMERSLQKTTMEVKGDWKPIIFLFTDGNPTDDVTRAFERWNRQYHRHCNLIVISIGDNVNTQLMGRISDNVFRLNETNVQSFKEFFKWVTASIKTSSVSVTDAGDDEVKLAPTSGINLEKVDAEKPCVVDENFAVFQARCQSTDKPYLIKFAKRLQKSDAMSKLFDLPQYVSYYKLVGAYPINGVDYKELSETGGRGRKMNTQELIGQPTCPCCGNQLGMVVCECGNIFCVGEDAHSKCPWCGLEGELSSVSDGGLDINRARG
ncbi:MAG: VWA domain-containing protein [Bacteroidales bacterium]|nr:VWA domain-containing protein [Bacteroidales bacterium]